MYTNTMGQNAPSMASPNPSGGIRLSFISPADQLKFEDLFSRAAASTGGNSLPAAAVRDILTRSKLDNDSLAKIWDLSSIANLPYLTFPEFAIAMYLTSEKLRGKLVPNGLPPAVREETELAMATLASKQTNAQVPQQPTSFMQQQQPMMQQAMMTGMPPQQPQQQFSFQNLMHPSNLSAPIQTPLRTGIAPPMYSNNTPRLGSHDFASKMMPNQSGPPNLLGGRFAPSAISWKISPEEKQQYRQIFHAWNRPGESYMAGDVAREVLMQSGLGEQDLMRIWHLADSDNQGSLDEDEFSIAMHLIYRKLNNFDIPSVLPTELAPPSKSLKKYVLGRQDAPPPPSFSRDPPQQQQQQTSLHEEREIQGGYVSSARRKGPASRFTSSSAARPRMQSYREDEEEEEDGALVDLRQEIAHTREALDRAISKSSRRSEPRSSLYSAEELKEKIRKTQEELTRAQRSNPKYFENQEILLDLLESQKTLQDEIQYLCNRDIPVLARQLRGATAELRDTKVRYARKNDGAQDFMAFIEPTGPGGIITESDRVRAKAKAMMAARKLGTSSKKDTGFELRKAEQEKEDYDRQADAYERDMERARDELRDLRGDLRYLNTLADSKVVVEKKRFDKCHDLPYELRRFVEQLQRDSSLDLAASPRYTPSSTSYSSSYDKSSNPPSAAANSPAATSSRSISSPKPAAPAKPRTAEEIKKEAERRVQERLAALQAKRSPGRSPKPSTPSTPSQPSQDELAAQQRLRDVERQAQEKLREGESKREEFEQQSYDNERFSREAELNREQAEREAEERRIREQQEDEQRRIDEEKELEARRKAVLEKEEKDRLARMAAIQRAQEEEEARQEARTKPSAPPAPIQEAAPPSPPPPPPPPAPAAPVAPPASAAPDTSVKTSSKNPFAKLQDKPEEPKIVEPSGEVKANSKRISYNPFAAFSAFSATKAGDDESDSDDDDGWDVVHHDDTDNEDEFPAAGSAKNLAGMLFNAMSQRKSPMMQPAQLPASDVPPPPPAPAAAPAAPPPPPVGAPAAPPAPAAPAASSDAPPASGGRNALLSQIQQGTRLRKAVTNDRSGASVSGKVHDDGPSAAAAPPPPQPAAPVAQQPESNPAAVAPSSNFLAELQTRTSSASPAATEAAPPAAQEGKEYTAQWAYTGQGEDDLSFEQDATIIVLNDTDPDWWYGTVKGTNQTGYFPKAYVQEPESAVADDVEDKVRLPAKALYDFEGTPGDDSLSFEAGASLVILNKDMDDWWRAEVTSTGKKGLVPANYVDLD